MLSLVFVEAIFDDFHDCYLLIREGDSEDFSLDFMADNNLLDNINPNFFEGVEKLLEIWFAPKPNADLRKIPRYTDAFHRKFSTQSPQSCVCFFFVQKILILAKYRFLALEIILPSRILENVFCASLDLHEKKNK